MEHKRKIMSYTMHINGEAEAVFPLLCPVREYKWIEPWQCQMVYTDSGFAELDCIFKTNFPQDGPEDTWVVSRYEPPGAIEFIRINTLRAIRYSIQLMGQEGEIGHWRWEQTITGLNAEGDARITALTDEAYAGRMGILEKMLNHFLEMGDMLKVMEH